MVYVCLLGLAMGAGIASIVDYSKKRSPFNWLKILIFFTAAGTFLFRVIRCLMG